MSVGLPQPSARPASEVAPRVLRSPDGRLWTIDRVRPRVRDAETFQAPFFWSSVVVTVLLVAFIARFAWVDRTQIWLFYVVPLALIWILERGTYILRPLVRAHTDGPPPESVMWRPTRRFGYGRVERRAAQAIEEGRFEIDLEGAPLVGTE
jgi:hypothetical protein